MAAHYEGGGKRVSGGRGDLDTLKRRGQLLAPRLKGVRTITYALFSARGCQDAAVEKRVAAGEAIHIPLSEMYGAI